MKKLSLSMFGFCLFISTSFANEFEPYVGLWKTQVKESQVYVEVLASGKVIKKYPIPQAPLGKLTVSSDQNKILFQFVSPMNDPAVFFPLIVNSINLHSITDEQRTSLQAFLANPPSLEGVLSGKDSSAQITLKGEGLELVLEKVSSEVQAEIQGFERKLIGTWEKCSPSTFDLSQSMQVPFSRLVVQENFECFVEDGSETKKYYLLADGAFTQISLQEDKNDYSSAEDPYQIIFSEEGKKMSIVFKESSVSDILGQKPELSSVDFQKK